MSSTQTPPLKIGVLGSGKGSNFVALHQSVRNDGLPVDICLVATDIPESGIIQYAEQEGLPAYTCPTGQFKTKLEPEIETALAGELKKAGAELIVLAGFMRVIKQPLLTAFPGRIINIHPSLLPDFKGMHAWQQALDAGVSETGCSVHWVDDSLDGGPVIAQKKVPVLPEDTAATLHARIQEQEHLLLPEVVAEIATTRTFG